MNEHDSMLGRARNELMRIDVYAPDYAAPYENKKHHRKTHHKHAKHHKKAHKVTTETPNVETDPTIDLKSMFIKTEDGIKTEKPETNNEPGEGAEEDLGDAKMGAKESDALVGDAKLGDAKKSDVTENEAEESDPKESDVVEQSLTQQTPPSMQQMTPMPQQIGDSSAAQSRFVPSNTAFEFAPHHQMQDINGAPLSQAQFPQNQQMPQMPQQMDESSAAQFAPPSMAFNRAPHQQMLQMENPHLTQSHFAQNQPLLEMLQFPVPFSTFAESTNQMEGPTLGQAQLPQNPPMMNQFEQQAFQQMPEPMAPQFATLDPAQHEQMRQMEAHNFFQSQFTQNQPREKILQASFAPQQQIDDSSAQFQFAPPNMFDEAPHQQMRQMAGPQLSQAQMPQQGSSPMRIRSVSPFQQFQTANQMSRSFW